MHPYASQPHHPQHPGQGPQPGWGSTGQHGAPQHPPARPSSAPRWWAPITVAALTVPVTTLAITGSFLDLVRISRTYGEGEDADRYATTETGWEGRSIQGGTTSDETTYSVTLLGALVVVAAVLLALGAAALFARRLRATGAALVSAAAATLVVTALLPILRISATLANDQGGDGETAYRFRADVGPGGYLLLVTGIVAAIAAVVAVVAASVGGDRPTRQPAAWPVPIPTWPHQETPAWPQHETSRVEQRHENPRAEQQHDHRGGGPSGPPS